MPHSLKTPTSDPCSGEVLESAKRAAEDLQAKYNRLTDSVKRQQRELAAVGINTRNLAHDEQGLKNRISETTAQLNRQRDALARVSAQQAKLNAVKQRYQAGKELAGNMAQWALPVWGLRRRERWPVLSC